MRFDLLHKRSQLAALSQPLENRLPKAEFPALHQRRRHMLREGAFEQIFRPPTAIADVRRQIHREAALARIEKRTQQVGAGALKERRPQRGAVHRFAEKTGAVQPIQRIVRNAEAVQQRPPGRRRLPHRVGPEALRHRIQIGEPSYLINGMFEIGFILQMIRQPQRLRRP